MKHLEVRQKYSAARRIFQLSSQCFIWRWKYITSRTVPVSFSFLKWGGHFRVLSGLCFKTRVGAQPLIWKSFFILMQIKLFFTRKVVHPASFWKWGFLELGSGLFGVHYTTNMITYLEWLRKDRLKWTATTTWTYNWNIVETLFEVRFPRQVERPVNCWWWNWE